MIALSLLKNGWSVGCLWVQTATLPWQWKQGLMHASSLPPDGGMLFDFGRVVFPYEYVVWNRNVLFDLDVAFLDIVGCILDVQRLPAHRGIDVSLRARAPYRYLLEVARGGLQRHGVGVGDHAVARSIKQQA